MTKHKAKPKGAAKPIQTLPATISLRVRDGAPNELHSFDLAIYETHLAKPGDTAKYAHTVDTRDIISALAVAQRKLIHDLREQCEPKHLEANERWLRRLAAWTVTS